MSPFVLVVICLLSSPVFPATVITAAHTWRDFAVLEDAQRDSHVGGMSELKKYFQRFGYLPVTDTNLTDVFDDRFETAVVAYQTSLGLPVTGRLDPDTMSEIMSQRCGVTDSSHATRRYSFFRGKPRWAGSPATLTYAFKEETIHMVDYLSPLEVTAALERAFSRWATVIPVTFAETEAYESADIRIGFYGGEHGDGEAFDGELGVLGHAFSPQNGRFHLDGAERWAVDFEVDKSRRAVDLESVVTHEIGHVLGLGHSSVKEAVMYPSLHPRTKKVGLKIDDVEGVQNLYGSNPDFSYTSLVESDNSCNQATEVECKWTTLLALPLLVMWVYT